MENEKIDGVEEELSTPPEVPEGEEDDTDWKGLAQKNYGIAQRYKTKFEKSKEVKPEANLGNSEEAKPVKEGFDYAELAYLSVKGISDEDISFVEQTAKDTGKPLKDLLGTKWFQSELQERKEARTTKEAIPVGSKRSASSNKDSVDYWRGQIDTGKAKLSDIKDVNLRREVNNARIKTDEDVSKFTPDSVIISGKNEK